MPSISSNTLFHFTKLENLLGILQDDFYPRYHLEEIQLREGEPMKFWIPMVSFCDIPLSLISNHMAFYGNYGIGMSKIWAERNKLNPILYFRKGSEAAKILTYIYVNFMKHYTNINTNDNRPKPLVECLLLMERLLTYIKPYDGPRSEGIIAKYYDEREWRYVPDSSLYENFETLLSEKECNEQKLSEENEKLKRAKLHFQPNDINYIIIKSENERLDLIEKIDQIKSEHLENIRKVLLSKIISADQISQDF